MSVSKMPRQKFVRFQHAKTEICSFPKCQDRKVVLFQHAATVALLECQLQRRLPNHQERCGSVMVSTSAWHAVVRGSILGPGMLHQVQNLALNIRDCVSPVWRGRSAVGASLRDLGKLVYHTLCLSDNTL